MAGNQALPLASGVADALVAALREAVPPAIPEVRPEQIRASLDLTGDMRDTAGVTVSCGLSGPHDGANDVLSDMSLAVSAWTHLDIDESGRLLDVLAMAVQATVAVADLAPDGWRMTCQPGPLAMAETSTDGSYRVRQITATVFLQRLDEEE